MLVERVSIWICNFDFNNISHESYYIDLDFINGGIYGIEIRIFVCFFFFFYTRKIVEIDGNPVMDSRKRLFCAIDEFLRIYDA